MCLITHRYAIWWVRNGISSRRRAQQKGRCHSHISLRAHWNNQSRVSIADKTKFNTMENWTVKWGTLWPDNMQSKFYSDGTQQQHHQKVSYLILRNKLYNFFLLVWISKKHQKVHAHICSIREIKILCIVVVSWQLAFLFFQFRFCSCFLFCSSLRSRVAGQCVLVVLSLGSLL